MRSKFSDILAVVVLALILSACGPPETPQEVSQALCPSVSDGDVADVVHHSPVASANGHDDFSLDCPGVIRA